MVDTGRPQKKTQLPKEHSVLHDKFKPLGFEPVASSKAQYKPLDTSETSLKTYLPDDHSELVAQAQSKPHRLHDHQPVPSETSLKTYIPEHRGPVADQAQSNTSHQQRRLQFQADEVHTKPSRRHQNTDSKATRLRETGLPQGQNKSLQIYDHQPVPSETNTKTLKSKSMRSGGEPDLSEGQNKSPTLQSHYHGRPPSTVKPAKNIDSSQDEDKYRKVDADRTHHHDDTKEPGHENQKSKTSRALDQGQASVNVDGDYAVKYKLGLVPRRTDEPKRRSEYQRQFQWRDFERNSPLMTAARVIAYFLTYFLT